QTTVVEKLEQEMAQFLGVEAALCFGMGFATNSCNIPAFIGQEYAIFSDKLNHASIILGARSSGAKVYVFPHNDMDALENMVRRAIIDGQPRTNRPWKNIFILCEGIYSMEGTIVNLPRIIEIKKKYKVSVFLDEAHSIGAIGANGKGVVDYYNCNPTDIDILMGTFSKSFGASGGYIAGSKRLMDYIRCNSCCTYYANCMAPPIAAQCLAALRQIMDTSPKSIGSVRIKNLHQNTKYFREKLLNLGFYIVGDDDSPVVPLVFGLFGVIHEFSIFMSNNNIGAIIVGFPATALDGARCRFCISSSHSREMLDYIITKINEFGDKYHLKYYMK
ncbi:serine palmitoyltransferase 2-like, partial [Pempheris klunzingeri]|uniref:serine palmitoyltransferase 2-like n=1 Tax=Pempheris klunzingeri TaxID=3127111 RepID=UPI00398060AE